jgi:hypothetical protein
MEKGVHRKSDTTATNLPTKKHVTSNKVVVAFFERAHNIVHRAALAQLRGDLIAKVLREAQVAHVLIMP